MATRNTKPPAKPATKPGKGMTRWDEELARRAQLASGNEESALMGGNFVKTKSGVMTFNDAAVPGNKMRVLVLASVMENSFYTEGFDPDSPASPVCYAFGQKEGEMTPHEKSEEPQADACKGCPHNEWGSSDRGRGKACQNRRRLCIISEGDLENLEDAKFAYVRVPVTSTLNWAQYVRGLNESLRRPPFAVITEISLVPDAKTQFKMHFKFCEAVEDAELFEQLLAKVELAEKEIIFPYAPNSELQERQQANTGRGGKGGTAKHGRRVVEAPSKAQAAKGGRTRR